MGRGREGALTGGARRRASADQVGADAPMRIEPGDLERAGGHAAVAAGLPEPLDALGERFRAALGVEVVIRLLCHGRRMANAMLKVNIKMQAVRTFSGYARKSRVWIGPTIYATEHSVYLKRVLIEVVGH